MIRRLRQVSSRRRGKSLIEMLVVITAMTAILTTAGRLLHQLSKAERSVREATAIGRAELRLARDFRTDVRRASSAEIGSAERQSVLVLGTSDGTIRYVAADGAVLRVTEGTTDRRRDRYRLGSSSVALSIEADRLAVLAVEPRRTASNVSHAAAGPLRIVAAIRADHYRDETRSSEPPEEPRRPPAEAPRPEGASL